MRRDRRWSWRRAGLTLLGVLLLWQLSALMLPRELKPPAPLSWILRLVPAFGSAMQAGAESAGDAWDRYFANVDAQRRLQAAEAELERLHFALYEAHENLRRRAVLDEMLGWAPEPWQGAVVRVALHDAADRYRAMWLRAPGGAEIVGHAVATTGGLLGRIVVQNGRYVQALLVADVESAVDVISDGGTRAIVRGTGAADGRLNFVPRYEPLVAGEALRTTGADGAFPAGLMVGWVEDVVRDPEHLYLSARVRFAVRPEQVDWARTLPPPAPALVEAAP